MGIAPVYSSLRIFDDNLNFYGGIEREHGHANRRTGVLPSLTENLAQQLGCTVNNAGLTGEVRFRRDKTGSSPFVKGSCPEVYT